MDFPCMQGLSCPDFALPPPDGSYSILDALDHNGEKNPNHPVFRYADGEGLHTINWREAYRAFHTTARLVEAQIQKKLFKTTNNRPVVAILATLDSIKYYTLVIGLMRARYVPMLISTRNSDVAVAELLRMKSATCVFVSKDPVMRTLAQNAMAKLRERSESGGEIPILDIPSFQEMFSNSEQEDFKPLPRFKLINDMDSPAYIVHSSGSTAFPKLITLTHRIILQHGLIPYHGQLDVCGRTLSIHALPIFHIMGAVIISWIAMTGIVVGVFPPVDPPIVSIPDKVLSSAVATRSSLMFVVPSFVEIWAQQPSLVEDMKTLDVMIYAGGPLSQEVGDMLIENGVVISPMYGITEVGILSVPFAKPRPEGWQYWKLCSPMDVLMVPTDEENVFKVVVKETPSLVLAVSNLVLDGKRAFDTNDLVYRHPANPKLFCNVGRADDQIMHSTGEKTNPGPLEAILQRDRKIKAALMFGRGRFQAGVLITPTDEFAFNPSDPARLAEYRNMIWEAVEAANAYAPQHSKIFKELILVAHPSKPFEYTAKGTLRRNVCITAYHAEIEAAYQAFERSSLPDISPPSAWKFDAVKGFIREVVRNALSVKAADNANIFDLGGDSLAATYIRNTIIRSLRSSKPGSLAAVRALPHDFVYSVPSVNMLSAFVCGLALSLGDVDTRKAHDDHDPEEGVFQWPKRLNQIGQTILRVREGKGEPPLIVMHGGGGDIDQFVPLQEKFRSALWFVQVTPEVPLNSLTEHVAFYHKKIKVLRPRGPYRLAAHSASHMIILLLADMFQRDGDEILQLAFFDHFPTFNFVPSVYYDHDTLDITDPEMRWVYKKAALKGIIAMRKRQGARAMTAREMVAVWEGKSASENAVRVAGVLSKYVDEMFEFTSQLPGYTTSTAPDKSGQRAIDAVETWLKTLPFGPVTTIYVAADGVLINLPEEKKGDWKDLGALRCFPEAKIVNVKGGHDTMLSEEALIQDLQRGFF